MSDEEVRTREQRSKPMAGKKNNETQSANETNDKPFSQEKTQSGKQENAKR